jgi:hypothetical protein
MTAHNHAELLREFGFNLSDLGVVMLKVDPLPVREWVGFGDTEDVWVYAPEGHRWPWVKGPVAETGAHVTVKYGLLEKAYTPRSINAIGQLMVDYEPGTVLRTDIVEIFEEPAVSELGYACIVARIDDEPLRNWNAALSVLPHVDTYAEYKPHLTLGYVKKELATVMAKQMAHHLPKYVTTTGLSFGDRTLA